MYYYHYFIGGNIMAFFGSDWLEGYDPTDEYEFRIGGSSDAVYYEYYEYDDKPIGAPIHLEDGYDSLKEYELGIKHFKE